MISTPDSDRDRAVAPSMFRWPDKLLTILLAYGLVFVGMPALCVLSYLWIKGAL